MKIQLSAGLGCAVLIGILAVPIASIAGCSVEDIVQVRTPPTVQTLFDQPPTMTYREAGQQQQIVAETTKTALAQWSESYEDAGEWVSLISGMTGAAFDAYGPQLQALGALGGPLGSFLAGWLLLRKPGTVPNQILTDEKIDSYNKGKKDAAALLGAKA